MGANQSRATGFTLIAALLLLLLMSGLAVGLMYMTNTEARVGGNDLENNLAYYGAEAGMEKMTSDLGNLYSASQAPPVTSITALNALPPDVPNITYTEYNINVPVDAKGNPVTNVSNIQSGPNAGLVAEIIPMTLSVTAQRLSGAQVRMQRSVEVALIPVFQFGVFSDSDLSYFPGPGFDFAGRVATNGNFFVTPGGTLVFHSKITAAKEVIRDQLANGVDAKSSSHGGPVYIPNAAGNGTSGGCDGGAPATHCIQLGINPPTGVNPPYGGSYVGGPPPTGSPNSSWVGISTGTYNGWILNGLTGAKPLQLPFVGAGVGPVQIIRKPPAGEATGTTLSTSRLYNKAQIRILLADTAAGLHPDADSTLTDGEDVLLSEEAGTTYPSGVPVTGVGNTHFAYASNKSTDTYYDPSTDQVPPPGYTTTKEWPLIDGWLRVEVKKADGTWFGVTNEWLKLGFAKGLLPGAAGGPHPNAILILQQLADRDATETISGSKESSSPTVSRYNWYPINMYDAREGEVRDNDPPAGAPSPNNGNGGMCAANGVMNVIELDVGNLRNWLLNSANGKLVDNQTLNGYLLYFSDRRGMIADPNAVPPALTGEYGFEDTINRASSAGTPDGILDPNNPGTTQSPEDVDQNGLPDNWGAATIMTAFGGANPAPFNPFQRVKCMTLARKNKITAARHVLRLVDGALSKVPTRPDGTGGFTVASENPVYILGDYNANGGWATPDAAAAVIADAVTLLSNPAPLPTKSVAGYSDFKSFYYPTTPGSRTAKDTWYRVAIAAGKNINFPQPTGWAAAADYGTDGGVHNFLRYIENWPGNLYYNGSLVSLFYSQYATGVFKCCTTVYSPPTRKYQFDTLFLNPNNLPPGTPEFEDVNNVSYRQDFTPY
ncbi:MAG TPA: PilX N-terminal domain-containing pilus assembly protein [Terriglobales bacterium]|nr:PilX N-terminal domain-containing pilus assembly protein [Terriglobales bacterium]